MSAVETRCEDGSFSLELAVGASIFVVAVLLLAFVYQVEQTGAALTSAAREAARAASLTADPNDAAQAARQLATSRLTGGTCVPGTVTVATNTAGFTAGGTVTVAVACRTHPTIGPARSLRASADAVIDRYRGGLP